MMPRTPWQAYVDGGDAGLAARFEHDADKALVDHGGSGRRLGRRGSWADMTGLLGYERADTVKLPALGASEKAPADPLRRVSC